jgi:hypothetical protein
VGLGDGDGDGEGEGEGVGDGDGDGRGETVAVGAGRRGWVEVAAETTPCANTTAARASTAIGPSMLAASRSRLARLSLLTDRQAFQRFRHSRKRNEQTMLHFGS